MAHQGCWAGCSCPVVVASQNSKRTGRPLLWLVGRINTLRVRGGENHSKHEYSTHVEIPFAQVPWHDETCAVQPLSSLANARKLYTRLSAEEDGMSARNISSIICFWSLLPKPAHEFSNAQISQRCNKRKLADSTRRQWKISSYLFASIAHCHRNLRRTRSADYLLRDLLFSRVSDTDRSLARNSLPVEIA